MNPKWWLSPSTMHRRVNEWLEPRFYLVFLTMVWVAALTYIITGAVTAWWGGLFFGIVLMVGGILLLLPLSEWVQRAVNPPGPTDAKSRD